MRQWYVKKAISLYINPSSNYSFYDAGAGFCQYSDYILSKYKKTNVFASDLKIKYLKDYFDTLKSDKKKRFSFSQKDLSINVNNDELEPTLFDMVIAIDILEHIENDIGVLKNFYSSMKDGAFLIISTPSDLGQEAKFAKEHVRPGYSIADLCEKTKIAGFEVMNQQYTYGFWGNIYWHLTMKNSIKIMNISMVFIFILPFYLLLIFFPSILFMWLDMISKKRRGKGILMVLKKRVE
ncbi:MAG: hypothetical protein FWG98_08415 [Candidatus Cloacimonetes bacterium]|nr:hypothetical protein [Candidatus Cloacimonadota bacterium]